MSDIPPPLQSDAIVLDVGASPRSGDGSTTTQDIIPTTQAQANANDRDSSNNDIPSASGQEESVTVTAVGSDLAQPAVTAPTTTSIPPSAIDSESSDVDSDFSGNTETTSDRIGHAPGVDSDASVDSDDSSSSATLSSASGDVSVGAEPSHHARFASPSRKPRVRLPSEVPSTSGATKKQRTGQSGKRMSMGMQSSHDPVSATASKAATRSRGPDAESKWQVWLAAAVACGTVAMYAIGVIYVQFVPIILQGGERDGDASTQAEKDTPTGTDVAERATEGFQMGPFLAYFILTWDNMIGALVSPKIGQLSDVSYVRRLGGRRKPFILLGLPLAVLFFCLIPYAKKGYEVMIYVIFFSIGMAVCKPCQAAYLGDLFPAVYRTRTSALIYVSTGLSTIGCLVVGSFIIDDYGLGTLFVVLGITCVVLMLVTIVFVKEKEPTSPAATAAQHPGAFTDASDSLSNANSAPEVEPAHASGSDSILGRGTSRPARAIPPQSGVVSLGIRANMRALWHAPDRRGLYSLIGTFFSVTGAASVQTGISSFIVYTLNYTIGEASFFSAVFGLGFLVGAVASGTIKQSLTRRRVVLGSVLGIVFVALGAFFIVHERISLGICLVSAGFLGGGLVVNLLPFVFDECGAVLDSGATTGMFYLSLGSASITGPALTGALVEAFGTHRVMFLVASVCMLIGWTFYMLSRDDSFSFITRCFNGRRKRLSSDELPPSGVAPTTPGRAIGKKNNPLGRIVAADGHVVVDMPRPAQSRGKQAAVA